MQDERKVMEMYLGFKHLGIAASVERLNYRRSKIMGKRKKIMVMMKKKKEKKIMTMLKKRKNKKIMMMQKKIMMMLKKKIMTMLNNDNKKIMMLKKKKIMMILKRRQIMMLLNDNDKTRNSYKDKTSSSNDIDNNNSK